MGKAVAVLVMLMVVGCVGRYFVPADGGPDGSAPTDASGRDGPVGKDEGPDPDSGGCSPGGVPSSCDPVLVTGCGAGSCYVTPSGIGCVCPAGTSATGTACSTTVECAPGNVCAGTAPPGVCRKTCAPQASQCNSAETCIAIAGYTQIGFCAPN